MPLPLAPIVSMAIRYGAVALIGAVVAKRVTKIKTEKDPHREATMDTVADGLNTERYAGEDEMQVEASHGKWSRVWLGNRGFEIDSRILGRLRIRKLTEEDQK